MKAAYCLVAAASICLLLVYTALGLPCPVQAFWDIPCPGCGMTRAWRAALQLDLPRAFALHPMFWAVVPVFLALIRGGKLTGRRKPDTYLLLGLLTGFVICYRVRLWSCLGG